MEKILSNYFKKLSNRIKDNTESLYKTFNLIKEEDAAKLAAKN